MDDQPLVTEEKEAGLRLVQIIHQAHPVQVAFWLKSSDDEQWQLYIGGDWVEFQHSREAYKVVLQAMDELNDPNLDLPRTTVIPMNHPLARAALEFWQKYPGHIPAWSKDSRFGNVSVERVYLYPQQMINNPNASRIVGAAKAALLDQPTQAGPVDWAPSGF